MSDPKPVKCPTCGSASTLVDPLNCPDDFHSRTEQPEAPKMSAREWLIEKFGPFIEGHYFNTVRGEPMSMRSILDSYIAYASHSQPPAEVDYEKEAEQLLNLYHATDPAKRRTVITKWLKAHDAKRKGERDMLCTGCHKVHGNWSSDRRDLHKDCPKCGAKPGEFCTVTATDQILDQFNFKVGDIRSFSHSERGPE